MAGLQAHCRCRKAASFVGLGLYSPAAHPAVRAQSLAASHAVAQRPAPLPLAPLLVERPPRRAVRLLRQVQSPVVVREVGGKGGPAGGLQGQLQLRRAPRPTQPRCRYHHTTATPAASAA